MLCSRRQLNTFRRFTAWLLLIICAWMGSGGVLHHTETEWAARPLLKLSASLHRQTAAAPPDACAACEWTQGLLGQTVSVCRVQSPVDYLPPRQYSADPLLIARALRHRPCRAPPIFSSSFC